MSRAFVRETDAGEPAPERAVSPHPNHVTPRGLAALEAQAAMLGAECHALAGDETPAAAARRDAVARDLRWLAQRLAGAIVARPGAAPPGRVAFGSVVTLAEPGGATRTVAIVGEDEADAARGLVSWVSPLAKALADAAKGDVVTWRRPAGDLDLEILAVDTDGALR